MVFFVWSEFVYQTLLTSKNCIWTVCLTVLQNERILLKKINLKLYTILCLWWFFFTFQMKKSVFTLWAAIHLTVELIQQVKYRWLKMKRAAEISTGQLHSDTETITSDLSILRKPIKTSVNGLNEARKAFEDGSEEVCFNLTIC